MILPQNTEKNQHHPSESKMDLHASGSRGYDLTRSAKVGFLEVLQKTMKNNPIFEYFRSAFEEFGKVTWPTRDQAVLLTGVVIGVSFVVVVALGLVDLGLSEAYKALLKAL